MVARGVAAATDRGDPNDSTMCCRRTQGPDRERNMMNGPIHDRLLSCKGETELGSRRAEKSPSKIHVKGFQNMGSSVSALHE